tara:strand:- start:1139 stop:1441 length:303 start_codon:yes stop_codon:yes gene_type:complete
MESKGNPILIEMADQLPPASKSFQLITTSVEYPRIIDQAREDFYCFADLETKRESGMTGLATLKENGYENWLKDMEEEDRLRICGVLQMIVDLAQELDEE